MSSDSRTLRQRYDDVRARVASAAEKSGRRPSEIVLVAVTKHASIEDIRELVSLGHLDLGENRVQQLIQRAAIIEEFVARRRERGTQPTTAAAPVRWHMIGSLQRNKVKQAVDATRLIHSVDSLRLAEEPAGLRRRARQCARRREVRPRRCPHRSQCRRRARQARLRPRRRAPPR